MLCQNKSSSVAVFEIDSLPGREPHRYRVPPGAKVEVPDGYCKPYRGRAKKPMPAIITQICPAMRPCPGEYAPGVLPPTPSANEATPAEFAELLREMRSHMTEQQLRLQAQQEELAALKSGGASDLERQLAEAQARIAQLEGGGSPEPKAEAQPAPIEHLAADEPANEEEEDDSEGVDSEFDASDDDSADAGAFAAQADLDAAASALRRLKKDELVAKASELGLQVDASMTKDDLAEAIAAYQAANG